MTIKEEVLEEIRPEDLYTMERQLAYEEGSLKTVLEKAIDLAIQKTLEKVEKLVNNCMSRDPEVNEKLKRIGETEPIALMTKENGRWIRKSEVLELLKKLKEAEK